MLDHFDTTILQLLRQNARISISDLSKQVNLSRSAVSERIKRLESAGIIKGYAAQIALPTSGIRAYFMVVFNQANCTVYAKRLQQFPEIIACHSVTGDIDMVILIEAPTMERLNAIRDVISQWPEALSIKTYPLLADILG